MSKSDKKKSGRDKSNPVSAKDKTTGKKKSKSFFDFELT